MSDCTHPIIKCHKCHRYLEGDPNEITNSNKDPKSIDPSGYYPAKYAPKDYGFHIVKGPFTIELNWTNEGVVIGVWDNTDPDSEPLANCQAEFADCVNPRHPSLIDNPDQREITYGLT